MVLIMTAEMSNPYRTLSEIGAPRSFLNWEKFSKAFN